MKKVMVVIMLIFLFCSKAYAGLEFCGQILDTNLEAVLIMDDIDSEDGLLYINDLELEVNVLGLSPINKKFVEVELELETVLENGVCKIIYLELDEDSSKSYFNIVREINEDNNLTLW